MFGGERGGPMEEIFGLGKHAVLNFLAVRERRVVLKQWLFAVYIHIDDFGLFGVARCEARELRDLVAGALESLGFTVARESLGPHGRYIGYVASEFPARWEPCAEQLGAIVGSGALPTPRAALR